MCVCISVCVPTNLHCCVCVCVCVCVYVRVCHGVQTSKALAARELHAICACACVCVCVCLCVCACICVCVYVSSGLTEHTDRGAPMSGSQIRSGQSRRTEAGSLRAKSQTQKPAPWQGRRSVGAVQKVNKSQEHRQGQSGWDLKCARDWKT